MEAVWIAFFALLGIACTVAGPLILSNLTARQNRLAKQEDYDRQDELAARVNKAADDAAYAAWRASAQATEAARLLKVENERTAKAAAVVSGKLDVIHTLVDGNMTAAMQSEYDATVRELAMMREVLRLHEVAGRDPTPDALAAIEATRHKIDELRSKLHDRMATEAQIYQAPTE